jgi:hypothetical protein
MITLLVAPGVGCGNDSRREDTPALLAKLPASDRRGADGAVLRLWRLVQIGSLPVAVAQYDPRVVETLGARDMAGALARQQSKLALVSPKIVSSEPTDMGTLVIANAEARGRAVGRFSFLVGRTRAGWRIRYDTLLAESLAAYVQDRMTRASGTAKRSPRAAAQAGQRALEAYRVVFASGPLEGSSRREGR